MGVCICTVVRLAYSWPTGQLFGANVGGGIVIGVGGIESPGYMIAREDAGLSKEGRDIEDIKTNANVIQSARNIRTTERLLMRGG